MYGIVTLLFRAGSHRFKIYRFPRVISRTCKTRTMRIQESKHAMISRYTMPRAPATYVPFATIVLLTVAIALTGHAAENAPNGWSAKWIWRNQADCQAYNQTVIARKQFQLDKPASGRLRITADSYYRLYVNGTWVNDGPSRCWPEHFQYDELDVSSYLRDGANEIRVIARYYGVGDFHRVPKQAGLLAQLDAVDAGGNSVTIATRRQLGNRRRAGLDSQHAQSQHSDGARRAVRCAAGGAAAIRPGARAV